MLLDKYLPKYTYREYHDVKISCPKEYVYAAARNLDLSKSKIIKALFIMRGLPTRDMTLEGFSRQGNFTFLEEIPNEEFIVGFWANGRIEKIPDREEFIIDNESKRIKVVWNFQIKQVDKEVVLLSTETRIYCITRGAKIFFSIYWAIIRPFSGLIRRIMLAMIKDNAENSFIRGRGRIHQTAVAT